MIAAALNSPALCCLEGPEEACQKPRTGEHQGQVAADLRGMQAPVRGAAHSTVHGRHGTAHWRRLLSESRLASTYEPPAEEPNQSTNNSDHGHRYARDGPRGEVGATITGSTTNHEVAEDGATVARWSRAARSP